MARDNRTSGTARPDVPSTSPRLQRAATAERRALERKRDRLTGRRDSLLAELEPIERALGELDERVQLLQRLIGDMPTANGSPSAASATGAGEKLLRGQRSARRPSSRCWRSRNRSTRCTGMSSCSAPATRSPARTRWLCS